MQARIDELENAGEEPTNRRNMLRGLGAAAAGAAVGGLAFARPAAADSGSGLLGNVSNSVTSQTALVAAGTYVNDDNWGLLHLTDDGSEAGSAVALLSINATGAEGFTTGAQISSFSTALKLSAPVPLKLDSSSPPSMASGTRGQFIHDEGDLWFCVSSSGSQRWRRISGPDSAGGFNALTPGRVYDSRAASPFQGVLGVGSRTVSVADRRNSAGAIDLANFVPANAKAVSVNLTITDTTGAGGFLCLNPGGNTSNASSAINWYGAGQKAANNMIVAVNSSRQLTAVVGSGSGGTTHFILDVNGYYL